MLARGDYTQRYLQGAAAMWSLGTSTAATD